MPFDDTSDPSSPPPPADKPPLDNIASQQAGRQKPHPLDAVDDDLEQAVDLKVREATRRRSATRDLKAMLLFLGVYAYLWLLCVACLVVSAKTDFSPPLTPFLWIFTVSLIFGAFSLMLTWATIGPTRFWLRWLSGFAGSVFGFNSLIVTMFLVSRTPNDDFGDVLRLNFAGPLAFLFGQAPLWIGRIILGWKIRRPEDDVADEDRRFGIGQILLVMALLGGAMTLSRFSMPEMGTNVESLAFSIGVGLYLTVVITMFAIPILHGTMLPDLTIPAAVAILIYFLVLFLLPTSVAWFFSGVLPWQLMLGMFTACAGYSTTFVAVLLFLRSRRYLLELRFGGHTNILASPFASRLASPFAQSPASPHAQSTSSPFAANGMTEPTEATDQADADPTKKS